MSRPRSAQRRIKPRPDEAEYIEALRADVGRRLEALAEVIWAARRRDGIGDDEPAFDLWAHERRFPSRVVGGACPTVPTTTPSRGPGCR